MKLETVRQTASQLATEIRELAKSQVETWRRVPYLALQADGRSGHSEGIAYQYGIWPIQSTELYGRALAGVDCASGDIVMVFPYMKDGNLAVAMDGIVLRIATHPEQVDGEQVLASLKATASQEHMRCYDPAKQQAWRDEIAERRHVTPVYLRRLG